MVTEAMTHQGNLIQAPIEEAIHPGPIIGEALTPSPMVGKALNRGSIVEQSNKSKSYCGKAINLRYWSLSNNRLELTAGSGIRSSQFVSLAVARRSSA